MPHLYMILIAAVIAVAFSPAWALAPLIVGALVSLAAPEE